MESTALCGIARKDHIEVDQWAVISAHSRAGHAAGEVRGCNTPTRQALQQKRLANKPE